MLLNKKQKFLLKFQRKNIIESSSSSNESDQGNMVDSLNLMEHKNPMIRLAFFGKMKKIVTSYNNSNLKGLDKRLFRGLFLRNLDHYDEDNISNVKML